MKNLLNLKPILVLLGLIISSSLSAQNLQTMLIEKMENTSIVIPEQCSPENMIVVVNSSIQDLKFESNVLPNDQFIVTYNAQANQYVICHEKSKFKLMISGPNLQSEEIEIFDLEKPLVFRVTANTAKGSVNIITNPRNAMVIFPELGGSSFSTNQPITNISGKYKVNIIKPQYKTIDTTIIIPNDAEKTYNFNLTPQFTRIKLDLRTDDNMKFQKAPELWVDSSRINLEAMVKPGASALSFFDDVKFFSYYEGSIIPMPEGIHKIKISAESYNPFETTIQTKNGEIHNISISLEPIYGFITLVASNASEDANVFIDNQKIGKVPLFKYRTKVGKHVLRFEKPGYITESEEFPVEIFERKNTDFEVSMRAAKKVNVVSAPAAAEVLVDGARVGFTPISTVIYVGNHELLIRKNGYATERIIKVVKESNANEETLKFDLRANNLLEIKSEQPGLSVHISGKNENQNVLVEGEYKTPASIPLPYGLYKISLSDSKFTLYKSTIRHSIDRTKRDKLPVYSKSCFNTLELNMGKKQNSGGPTSVRTLDDIDNLEFAFGRIHIFRGTGLSTALIDIDYKSIKTDSITFKTIAPNVFLLNWDWRLGGAVMRQIDVNLLGRVKYSPGFQYLGKNTEHLADVKMLTYFLGFEVSTRLPIFNLNWKFGRQISKGELNYWDASLNGYKPLTLPDRDMWVATLGITLNGRVYKSNNMLRLWHKPLIDPYDIKSVFKSKHKGDAI